MGPIKINRINLPFKISVSIGDNTNVMQAVAPNEQFNQSAVGIAVKYPSIVLRWSVQLLRSRLLYLQGKTEIVCNYNLACHAGEK